MSEARDLAPQGPPGGPDDEPPAADNDDDLPDLSLRPSEYLRRDAQLLGRKGSRCRAWLRKKIDAIARGFEKQGNRSWDLSNWWDLYHCNLGADQFYEGTAQVYIPAIRDALDARATRFTNQLFPSSGQYVECTASDGVQPFELIALLNHYIAGTDSQEGFKAGIVKPLFLCSDIEGQYNLYMDWTTISREVVSRETRGAGPDGEEIIDIKEEEIEIGFPSVEIIHDNDVLVLPAHAPTALWALNNGGSVTIVRRWSKDKAEEMAEAGEIDTPADDTAFGGSEESSYGIVNLAKDLAKAVGIKLDGAGHYMTVFETWLMVPFDLKKGFSEKAPRRLCRMWWSMDREPQGLKRNPYWNDRCPLISKPRQKVPGVFKGQSAVEHLAPIQYEINDAANERADVDHMAAMPIIRRDPATTGNRPTLIAPAAMWDGPERSYEFLTFPDLSNRAKMRVMDGIQLIFQSLSVNPSMLPQQTGRGAKRNQAEVALEQQVDLLTTAENVTTMEEVLNEVLRWCVDLDHQFRDRDMTVRAYGYMGLQANMIQVPPIQNGTHYHFKWIGAEQARMSAAMAQQGTAFFNLLRGMQQPLMAEGIELKMAPFIEKQAAMLFGPTMAAQLVVDKRHHQSIPPEQENEMLGSGYVVPVSPFDNHQKHLQSHMQARQMMGDPAQCFDLHIREHMNALAAQAAQAQQAQRPPGAPGVPGGAGPGVAGTPGPGGGPMGPGQPQPGAVPAGPRLIKGPPGMIPQDQMPRMGAPVPPRRA